MSDIRYISTRGDAPVLSFEDAVLAGLASDGGLYVPDHIPALSKEEINRLQSLSYADLAYEIISCFTGNSIGPDALRKIITDAYKEFRHADIAPLHKLNDSTYVLELFHGPTLAFKDFALQFLGRLLDHILEKRKQKVVIVGATSGDTGSAAIAGCRGRRNMDIFILYPQGRISQVQRRQMTTVLDKNVRSIALEGTFDDCQNMLKALFADAPFRDTHHLTAVNSINWARIVAQVPYYFYAALKLGAPDKKVSFSVPTGNFGDIFAGYIAKRMGLPIDQLIIACNSNDILSRCLATGTYSMSDVKETISPSMDIQVSSNFERLLFDLYGRNAKAVVELMNDLKKKKSFSLSPEAHAQLKQGFSSAAVNHDETVSAIRNTYQASKYLLDPHTAVGVAAAGKCRRGPAPLVALATAHPAKFPDAVQDATGVHPPLPDHLKDLFIREERFAVLRNEIAAVKAFIQTHTHNDLPDHHS